MEHAIIYILPGTGKTRNEERRNGKREMGNDAGNEKLEMKNNGRNCISSKHSATELAVTMKSHAYRLAVVLQPSLLC